MLGRSRARAELSWNCPTDAGACWKRAPWGSTRWLVPPETEIMVTYLDLRKNQVEEVRFPLWQEEIFRAQDGSMLGPDNIAQEIWTWLIEP
jgi:hypothetical protein